MAESQVTDDLELRRQQARARARARLRLQEQEQAAAPAPDFGAPEPEKAAETATDIATKSWYMRQFGDTGTAMDQVMTELYGAESGGGVPRLRSQSAVRHGQRHLSASHIARADDDGRAGRRGRGAAQHGAREAAQVLGQHQRPGDH